MSIYDATSGQFYATISDAITGSAAGDDIRISAGTYVENFPTIAHSLTIEAVGGIAYLSNPQPDPPNGRAVLDVPGNLNVDLTISGLDISGAVDDASDPPSHGGANGAGILFESGNGALVVNDSHIHNNEDGILTGGGANESVTISDSEIDDNGVAPGNPRYGYDHNIYIGAVQQFTITGSYVHDALGGNEIKSRALASTIENNRIFDNAAAASYEIDLPNGGTNIVENNIIEKGLSSPQDAVADSGAESSASSPSYAASSLIFSGNTIVNESTLVGLNAYLVSNDTVDPATGLNDPATISQNLLYGMTNLFGDFNGTPNDITSGDTVLPLASAPVLDTSSPFPPQVACFAHGTRIATPDGPMAVEHLAIDDIATTLLGGPGRIVWIGSRTIDCTRHPRPETVWPIRISRDAFAPSVPERDLFVSPDHAIYVDGALILARYLTNGTTVAQVPHRAAVYYHIELERHDVLLAEGLPAESYLDTGNRAMFETDRQPLLLHPDFAGGQRRREALSRAPLLSAPEELEPVWRALADRAAAIGRPVPAPAETTEEPALHLLAGQRRTRPSTHEHGRHAFAIHAGPERCALISRAARPTDGQPWLEDRRLLGVRVRRLLARDADGVREIALDSPELEQGWWAVEHDTHGPCRWTNGEALLPALRTGVLEIELAGTMRYAVAGERPACPARRSGAAAARP